MSQPKARLTFRFRGPWAIIAAILIVVGAVLYNGWRCSSLEAEGRPQVEDYLSAELLRKKVKKKGVRNMRPADLETLFEITHFETAWIPRDDTRVRVHVKTKDGEETYHFRFKRVLGSWVLRNETRGRLLGL